MMKPRSLLIALTAVAICPALFNSGAFRATADEPTPVTAKPIPWEKDIEAFEQKDIKTSPPADAALFIGSSSFRRWTTLTADFPEIPVINRGFGGSQIADSAHFVSRIVLPYRPRIVIIYAGGNDLAAGKTPEQVLKDFQEFVTKVRAGLPGEPIVYVSTNPTVKRWEIDDKVRETNRLIADYSKTLPKLTYIDSYTHILGADGKPQKDLLVEDGLHFNADGYKAWTAIIKPQILKLYGDAKP